MDSTQLDNLVHMTWWDKVKTVRAMTPEQKTELCGVIGVCLSHLTGLPPLGDVSIVARLNEMELE